MEKTASSSKASIYAINPDLQKKVAPILTNMVTTILMKKPQDPVSQTHSLTPSPRISLANPVDSFLFTFTAFYIGAPYGPVFGGTLRRCNSRFVSRGAR